MSPLAATVSKELRLLARDRYGLLVLFIMPAVLVVVLSLVQENLMKTTGAARTQILFIDQDQQAFGRVIRERLQAAEGLELITELEGQALAADQARMLTDKGRFQACIIVPAGTTEAARSGAVSQIAEAFAGRSRSGDGDRPRVSVYFDPLAQGALRSSIVNALRQILLTVEMAVKAEVVAQSLPHQVERVVGEFIGRLPLDPAALPAPQVPAMDPSWGSRPLLEVVVGASGLKKLPTSVQHNVSAWSVFGIFFIVLPLGGIIIRERQDGTLARLRMLPVPYVTLLLGKLVAYVGVCWAQFAFIVLTGKWLLPLLGTPVLSLGSDPAALAVTVTLIALAACGYGLMLGTLARTFEQSAMFGAVSVVCAAALGGVMVPVYVMPPLLQTISVFSPLAWGLNALIEIAVRDGTLQSVRYELGFLAAFCTAALLIAWAGFSRLDRRGGTGGG